MRKINLKQTIRKPVFWYIIIPLFFLTVVSSVFAGITLKERNSPAYRVVLKEQVAIVNCPFKIDKAEVVITEKYRSYPVKVVEKDSFIENKKLEKIILPPTIESLAQNCFSRNENLLSVTITSPIPPYLNWGLFVDNHKDFKLIIPKELSGIYTEYCTQGITGWHEGLLAIILFE